MGPGRIQDAKITFKKILLQTGDWPGKSGTCTLVNSIPKRCVGILPMDLTQSTKVGTVGGSPTLIFPRESAESLRMGPSRGLIEPETKTNDPPGATKCAVKFPEKPWIGKFGDRSGFQIGCGSGSLNPLD